MIISILATTGLSLVLYLTGFFVLFTPLPYLLTASKKGWGASLAATILSLAILVLLYRLPAEPLVFLPLMAFYPTLPFKAVMGLSILYLSYFVWIAWVVTLGSRMFKESKMEAGFVRLMVAILVPTLVGYFLLSAFLGMNLSHDLGKAFQGILQKMVELKMASKMSGQTPGDELEYLQKYAPDVVRSFLGVFPSLWIVFTMMVLSINVMFVRRWTLENRPFPNWEAFHLWRLGERWIWAPIAVGTLYFLNLYFLKKEGTSLVLINVLIVLGSAYFYQGLSIVSFFLRKKLSPWTRLMAYLSIFLFLQPVGAIVLAVGIFDFWFDFRKLKKVGNAP